MSVSKLKKLVQTSPYSMLVAHNKGESISMVYNPWHDIRVPTELLESKVYYAIQEFCEKLGVKGCVKVPPQEAERLLLESQQYYREALSV
jgi:hypothetical protein